jgi:Zn finger protein HypA/HybF involved in hydrogenase expression
MRIRCRKCGREWNVSEHTNEKDYSCPYCSGDKEYVNHQSRVAIQKRHIKEFHRR